MSVPMEKVTALVTRGRGLDATLLVFRHPQAGIQLPASTVETGELFEAAVLRELREETGLHVGAFETPTEAGHQPGCVAGSRLRCVVKCCHILRLTTFLPILMMTKSSRI